MSRKQQEGPRKDVYDVLAERLDIYMPRWEFRHATGEELQQWVRHGFFGEQTLKGEHQNLRRVVSIRLHEIIMAALLGDETNVMAALLGVETKPPVPSATERTAKEADPATMDDYA